MKTRAQIYSHEASGILRDISTYGVLTQKQISGLYPQKDDQIKNLLTYLCKQKRLFLVNGFYSLTPELPKDRDRGLEAAVTILADFMEQVEYHAAGEYPVKIIFLAGGEVYEILYAEPDKEAILNLLLVRPEQEPPVRLVILEDAVQINLLAISSDRGDHFWDSAKMNLLKALVLFVERSYPPERRNIGEAYQLLVSCSEKELNKLFDALPLGHPARAPYSIFRQSSESVCGGVIISLGTWRISNYTPEYRETSIGTAAVPSEGASLTVLNYKRSFLYESQRRIR